MVDATGFCSPRCLVDDGGCAGVIGVIMMLDSCVLACTCFCTEECMKVACLAFKFNISTSSVVMHSLGDSLHVIVLFCATFAPDLAAGGIMKG